MHPSTSHAAAHAGGFGLNGPNSTLSSLGILALIVTVHECGHFLAARLQGIHVTQFAIGFGPPLLTFKVRRNKVAGGRWRVAGERALRHSKLEG